MSAIARLVWSFFTCTTALRAFTVAGVLLCAGGFIAMRSVPQSGLMAAGAMLGVGCLYVGGSMMPLMFGQLALSRLLRILPHGRTILLASGLITIALLALPAPLLGTYGLMEATGHAAPSPELAARIRAGSITLFWTLYTSVFVLTCWLSVAMWFVTSQRNTAGFLKGLIVIAVVLVAPARNLRDLDAMLQWNVVQCVATCLVFGAGFLLWPRVRVYMSRFPSWPGSGLERLRGLRVTGKEVDLLLGTANPWVLALAQVVPILLATRIGYYSSVVWLFYLTIFSTVAGAIAGQAAERSRALWLRGDWSRAQMFAQVERSFWRHNSFVLCVLLALMVAIGSYSNLPAMVLLAGLPLLVLGTVLSTYLGLMVTRGVRWLESGLAIGVMLALMAVAILIVRSAEDLAAVIVLEVALAIVAVLLRHVARARWAGIDWMLCRPDRTLAARSAA